MALETITNTVASYHEPIKIKPEVKVEPIADTNTQTSGIAKDVIVVSSKDKSDDAAYDEQAKQQEQDANLQKRIKSAVNHTNQNLKYTRCEFSYHEETKRVSIKIFDKKTNEVIKEIPPEESLDLVERIWELAGIIVDERR